MPHDYLGLFDTPPSRLAVRIAVALVGLVIIVLLAALPVCNIHVGTIPGLVPAMATGIVICDLVTATFLYAQAAQFRSRALTVLASGYVFAGLVLIPWALTFPGAFSANGLLGAKVNTTAWLATFWRLSVPVAVFIYGWLKRTNTTSRPVAEQPPARLALGLLTSITLAVFVTLLATLGHDLMPSFFIDRSDVIRPMLIAVNAVVMAVTIAAIVILFRQRRSVLDLWLLVALSSWLAQSLLNMQLQSRFTLGAHIFFALALLSNLTVILALIAESTQLYARLALATAKYAREREARLMSMDGATAAISHEVGQPLTAVITHAIGGLNFLDRNPPDIGLAKQALRATLDAGHRTFEVIKSIRAMFVTEAAATTELNLNQLAVESLSLLSRELTGVGASLELALDEALPPVLANRVQLQRVLVNLLMNAVESLDATQGRPRRIAIRSLVMDDQNVLLELSDNGIGIAPEDRTHIFESFFTTKATGTGLGLSLCRTIVEEHGGRLRASHGDDYGVTFHLQLPTATARPE